MADLVFNLLGDLFGAALPETRVGQWVLLVLCVLGFVATILIVVLALSGSL